MRWSTRGLVILFLGFFLAEARSSGRCTSRLCVPYVGLLVKVEG